MEEKIAASITDKLKLRFSEKLNRELDKKKKLNPEAWQHYLKGRFLSYGSTQEEVEKAVEHFREATRIERGFALGYAGIADALYIQAFFSTTPPAVIIGEARTAANSAIALDPHLAEAHTALGAIRFYFDFDLKGAEASFKKALEINPSDAVTYVRYANLLMADTRMEEALAMANKALELDPVSTGALHALGITQFLKANYEASMITFEKAIELHPHWIWGYVKGGRAAVRSGKKKQALEWAAKAEQLTNDWGSARLQAWLADIHRQAGKDDLLVRCHQRLKEAVENKTIKDPVALVEYYFLMNDIENTLVWMRKTVDSRSPGAVTLKMYRVVKPEISALTQHPEYQAMLAELGLE